MEIKHSILDGIPSRYEMECLLTRYKNGFTKEQYEYLVYLFNLERSAVYDNSLSEEARLDLLKRDAANEEPLYPGLARYNIVRSALDTCLEYAPNMKVVSSHKFSSHKYGNKGFKIYVSNDALLQRDLFIPVFGFSFQANPECLSTGATEINIGTISLFQAVSGKTDKVKNKDEEMKALIKTMDSIARKEDSNKELELDYYRSLYDRIIGHLGEEELSNDFFNKFCLLYGLPEDWCSATPRDILSSSGSIVDTRENNGVKIKIIRY